MNLSRFFSIFTKSFYLIVFDLHFTGIIKAIFKIVLFLCFFNGHANFSESQDVVLRNGAAFNCGKTTAVFTSGKIYQLRKNSDEEWFCGRNY